MLLLRFVHTNLGVGIWTLRAMPWRPGTLHYNGRPAALFRRGIPGNPLITLSHQAKESKFPARRLAENPITHYVSPYQGINRALSAR
jgi:hypothetical protein